MFDDVALLEQVAGRLTNYGPITEMGKLKSDPNSFVIAARKTSVDTKIQVH